MFFPRKSCLLSLNLFKKVAFSGSGDELPFASGYELQFLFDENNLNIVTPTQGPKNLKMMMGLMLMRLNRNINVVLTVKGMIRCSILLRIVSHDQVNHPQ